MLIDGNLPPFLWEEALGTVNFVRNRVPSRSLPNRGVTPFELWTGAKPNLSMLRVWGCLAYVMREGHRQKLEPKADMMVYVGPDSSAKCWRFYDPVTLRIKRSRNAVFDELNCGITACSKPRLTSSLRKRTVDALDTLQQSDGDGVVMESFHARDGEVEGKSADVFDEVDVFVPIPRHEPDTADVISQEAKQATRGFFTTIDNSDLGHEELSEPALLYDIRRSSRDKVPSSKLDSSIFQLATTCDYVASTVKLKATDVSIPRSFEEAQRSPYWKRWESAMHTEYDALIANGIWELMVTASADNIVKSCWVFDLKMMKTALLCDSKLDLLPKATRKSTALISLSRIILLLLGVRCIWFVRLRHANIWKFIRVMLVLLF